MKQDDLIIDDDNSDLNISLKDEKNATLDSAPLIIVNRQIIFPFSMTPIVIEDANLLSSETAMSRNRLIAVFPEMPSAEEIKEQPDINWAFSQVQLNDKFLSRQGILCRIVKKLNFPDGTTRVLVRGISRISMSKINSKKNVFYVTYKKEEDAIEDQKEIAGLLKSTTDMFQEFSNMNHGMLDEFRIAILNLTQPGRIADLIAEAIQLNFVEKLMLLTCNSVKQRLYQINIFLNRNMEIFQIGAKIQNQVHESMGKSQREYFLREQLKTIKKELSEDSRNPDIIDIEDRLKKLVVPEKVETAIKKELSRLEVIPQMSPEYHIAYNYVDTLLNIPWNILTEDRLNVKEAEIILDEDHYGLKDVKERILEFLSILQLKKDKKKSPILCLVGPPGVGKTSLGQSIARALNREFVRMALGGVRDEAEIRGHRRTYIGAMPGRIIQNLIKLKTSNPVFMLDEIDKLNSDFRGDPASALLEVLDSAQNNKFIDNYVELEFDLSNIFFIATANTTDSIPAPLLDRMELIRLPGYTAFEKREIASRYLVARAINDNGLSPQNFKFNKTAISELIDYYTREAGVRQLERVISQASRKVARKIVDGEYALDKKVSVTPTLLHELLGARKYVIEEAEKKPDIGCATGMAWTSVGGVILIIETLKIPGKGALKLTGSLGKVMQESAEAAFTYIKSKAESWGIAQEVFEKYDFHLHVPDGATPKDGPSAGITIATALYSLLTNKQVKPLLSMTGEINLRGKITIIGGVKEKVIAALRSKIKEIILPEENRKDLEDIPEEIRSLLTFHFVKSFDDAIKIVFKEKK